MKKNNINKKIIFSSVIFVILLVAVLFLNYLNENRKKELFDLRKEFKTNLSLPRNEQLIKKMEDLNIKVENVSRHIFEGDNPVVFIEAIENIGNDLGLTVSVQSAETSKKENGFGNEIRLIVLVDGSLTQLEEFLSKIEGLEKELFVGNVDFSRIQKEDGFSWRGIFNIVANTK